jgi:hypothetical protein
VWVLQKDILHRTNDLAVRNKGSARLRTAWVSCARAEVVEIDIGSGLSPSTGPTFNASMAWTSLSATGTLDDTPIQTDRCPRDALDR